MKLIDFHTHTNASDGLLAPQELVQKALKKNLIALAITDHDTIAGLAEVKDYASDKIDLIAGIEFSVEYETGSFHLLGLKIDPNNQNLLKISQNLQTDREQRFYQIIEQLKEVGIKIPPAEFKLPKSNESLGRPHLARIMVKYGYGETLNDIFKKYLTKGKPGYVKKKKLSLKKAVSSIKQAGGIPIIAHPSSLNFKNFIEFKSLLKRFIQAGVEGLEVFSSMHTPEQVEIFYKIAQKYDLYISGGSDFHGDRNEKLGYYNHQPIPLELYDFLKE